MKKDIYIIKNTINDKVYIGQSKNAAERWLSHVYDARYQNKTGRKTSVLHRAMMKYGVDKFHYEILEYQVTDYDEREKYWIGVYNSIAPNGYNVSVGGGGCGYGQDSIVAVFKDTDKLLQCISEISTTNKSFLNIAKKFGCSYEVISAINSGQRYKMENFKYPLRDTETRYPEFLVKQIRYSLKYETDLTIRDIAKKYNVDISQVSLINNGHIYFLKSESYPLKDKRVRDLDKNTVHDITLDIINSDLSLSDIAAKYNLSRSKISGINKGKCYKNAMLRYPLREDTDSRSKSLKKFLDKDTICEIQDLLKTNMSVSKIAEKFGVSKSTINNINNGKCKKYVINGEEYPIRKIS